jgi:hypothetical protein
MRKLAIAMLLGLAGTLCWAGTAQAQLYFPFGQYPVPYRTYNAGYHNGQLFTVTRYGFLYPGSGYTYGFSIGYMPQYGVVTGYYNSNISPYYTGYVSGNPNPFYSSYQFTPSYISPGYYYAAQASQPNYGFTKTPTYSYPAYYTPTY